MRTPERRKYLRYGFQADAEIVAGSESRKAFITDISMGGMFVVTEAPLLVGAACTVRLLLDPPMTMSCIVRRVLFRKGMGMEIDRPSDVDRARLERLVTRLASP